jgi:hypothetical protein
VQQLHLVGFTTDLDGLIFSARRGSKSGSFVVSINDGLLATIEDARRLREGEPESTVDGEDARRRQTGRMPRPESTLSPREIQARLRAGSTITEVAKAAGVDDEWVSRFAVPILAEQHQVVERARQYVYSKARLGSSAQPLGTSVLWNLVDRGLRMTERAFASAWRAWNLQGAVWVVQFTYVSRQRSQSAEWEVDLREGTLHARNRLAADLGYVEPGRRRRSQPLFEPPDDGPTTPDAGARGPGRSGRSGRPGKGAAAATAGVSAGPAKSAAGKRAVAKKAPAKKAAVKKAAATKAAATKAAATKAAAKKTAPRRGAAGKAAGKRTAGTKAAGNRPAAKRTTSKRSAGRKTGKAAPARPTRPATRAVPTPASTSVRGSTKSAAPAAANNARRAGAGRSGTARARTPGTRTGGSTSSVAARRAAPAVPPPPSGPPGGGRSGRAGPVNAPAVERVSHLARPAQPPDRRGAARDGTPTERSMTASSRGSVAPALPPRPSPRVMAPSERPPDRPIERPRIERVRGRPQPESGAPSSQPAPARPRPVVPPPPVAARAVAGEVAIQGDDASVVIRRPSQTRPPADGQAEEGAQRGDRLSRRLSRREPADSPRPVRRPVSDGNGHGPTGPGSRPAGGAGGSASGAGASASPARTTAGAGASASPAPDEPIWHGPGSGEPAPPVRIRADLAAAATARSEGAGRTRRSGGRERPLRAR